MNTIPLTRIIKHTGISKADLYSALDSIEEPRECITLRVIKKLYYFFEEEVDFMEGVPLLDLL